jgi:hypothetical protein
MNSYKYEKKLIKELKKINDDRDFILGILSFAGTEENFKICLDFINQGIDVTEQNLQMLSLDLDEEGPQAYEKYWKVNDDKSRNNK